MLDRSLNEILMQPVSGIDIAEEIGDNAVNVVRENNWKSLQLRFRHPRIKNLPIWGMEVRVH
jgi:hypothetical protein